MKKRGVTLIETVIAITIFLIGIIPVAQLTLNSLRNLKRASEIEEEARVATTVINYIKSQGYNSLLDSGGLLNGSSIAEKEYLLRLSDDKTIYTLDLTSNGGADFEKDFLSGTTRPPQVVKPEDSLFLINSLGINSKTITIIINIATSNLEIANSNFSPDTSYINPISNSNGGGVIIGSGGIIEDPIIYGNVYIEYKTLSNNLSEDKFYDQNFVITPLENFND